MAEVRAIVADATDVLGERLEAELLLLHVLGKPRSWLIAHADDELDDTQIKAFDALVQRRRDGEPVAYITGHRGFWTLNLEVTPATLIPRPETELLVELALARMTATARVADLGTGSGAIALAIARECPTASLVATDASADALVVASRNAAKHGIRNVRFAHGNWLAALEAEHFELIVSNPPYIEADDPHLAQGDLRFEPASALAAGADGLDDIRQIVAQTRDHLEPGGSLLMEHGWNQGPAVREVLSAAGYRDVFTEQDLEQRDRVSGGIWPGA